MEAVWYLVGMRDSTINLMGTNVIPHATEDGSEPAHLQVIMVAGIVLPIASGPGQPPLTVPTEVMRFLMDKASAIELANSIIEIAADLPDPPRESGLVLPGDPREVDALAQELGRFRG
jgi:hypothetical protein